VAAFKQHPGRKGESQMDHTKWMKPEILDTVKLERIYCKVCNPGERAACEKCRHYRRPVKTESTIRVIHKSLEDEFPDDD
jgi:hypothetical protein